MPLINLSQQHSLLNAFVAEIRDVQVQRNRLRFRYNMERCGEVLAYEISRQLPYVQVNVNTPLGTAVIPVPAEQPVVGAILRAGLILHQGMIRFFDQADNAFVSAYRKHRPDGSFDIAIEHVSSPPLNDRIFILADPMLATGRSMVATLQQLFSLGKPRIVHLACVIAARAGVEWVERHFPDMTIWACAVDEELNAQGYIVPGLGDAGDLSYGPKAQH
ncbi:MAG: uracil phosphoribosyltransferase [Chitinophagales bacterium]|nr:uracil phosphoribosyltransferase [Chitinophagales bacterium]MDW8394353.1 uracil phosphoribosyltransferase [Chitinophagales bacterium]